MTNVQPSSKRAVCLPIPIPKHSTPYPSIRPKRFPPSGDRATPEAQTQNGNPASATPLVDSLPRKKQNELFSILGGLKMISRRYGIKLMICKDNWICCRCFGPCWWWRNLKLMDTPKINIEDHIGICWTKTLSSPKVGMENYPITLYEVELPATVATIICQMTTIADVRIQYVMIVSTIHRVRDQVYCSHLSDHFVTTDWLPWWCHSSYHLVKDLSRVRSSFKSQVLHMHLVPYSLNSLSSFASLNQSHSLAIKITLKLNMSNSSDGRVQPISFEIGNFWDAYRATI